MLTRFAYSSSYYAAGNRVRHTAFMPPKDDLKTSVFRLGAVDHAGTLQHALEHCRPGQMPKGYAQVLSADVQAVQGLDLEDEEPPPCHVNIVGWPADIEEQKSLAIVIAANAAFVPA